MTAALTTQTPGAVTGEGAAPGPTCPLATVTAGMVGVRITTPLTLTAGPRGLWAVAFPAGWRFRAEDPWSATVLLPSGVRLIARHHDGADS